MRKSDTESEVFKEIPNEIALNVSREIPKSPRQALPAIKRASVRNILGTSLRSRSSSISQQLTCSTSSKTDLLTKYPVDNSEQKQEGQERREKHEKEEKNGKFERQGRQTAQALQRNAQRTQIYLKNAILMKLEKENFEKLKRDVAEGVIVLDVLSSRSGDSSAIPSPFEKMQETTQSEFITSEFNKELFCRIRSFSREENYKNNKNSKNSSAVSASLRGPRPIYTKSKSVSETCSGSVKSMNLQVKKKSISLMSSSGQYGGV